MVNLWLIMVNNWNNNGIIYIYTYIWVNYNDLTVLPNPGIMVGKGNHPQMAEPFRLVKYYNLPRFMLYCIYWLVVSYIYIIQPSH